MNSYKKVGRSKGVSHWKYRCPKCDSVRLRKRKKDPMNSQYSQSDDVKKYYCRSCKIGISKDEVVEATTEDSSFRYELD